jgi:hypothetical protein
MLPTNTLQDPNCCTQLLYGIDSSTSTADKFMYYNTHSHAYLLKYTIFTVRYTASTCVPLDKLPQWNAHGVLNRAGPVDVAADAVELGAAVVGAPKAGEPVGSSPQHGGNACDCLNVGDCGGRHMHMTTPPSQVCFCWYL